MYIPYMELFLLVTSLLIIFKTLTIMVTNPFLPKYKTCQGDQEGKGCGTSHVGHKYFFEKANMSTILTQVKTALQPDISEGMKLFRRGVKKAKSIGKSGKSFHSFIKEKRISMRKLFGRC